MSKIITVFGATGNQGGSVINSLLNDAQLSKTFKIRGVTRDTSKPAAQELEKRGVELVKVRLSEFPYGVKQLLTCDARPISTPRTASRLR
jgi:alpha-D-ribose 1-methylphosphonate 5-triphosphate synthase subunit PhnH